jgi:hypothetical protein
MEQPRIAVRLPRTLIACLFAAALRTATAGHPMLTEDTGTQGTGNAELEFGQSWSETHGARAFVFQPQLSYGLTPTLDLIVQPSWLANSSAGSGGVHGVGDTNVDAKWRFYGAAPLSLGIRAGAAVATSQHGLGAPKGTLSTHALLIATFDAAPFTLDANLGYLHAAATPGARRDLLHLSLAANYALTEHVILLVDADVDSNPSRGEGRNPAVLLTGMIYTMASGLDLDIGYRAGLNRAAPAHEWLLGLTYRWAP